MANEEARVRTFQTDQQPRRVEDTFFMRFPYLRILELSDSLVQSIPDYIGKLIYPRLLDLDGTCVSCLPESISSLINLQILNLQRCQDLHSLPLAITRLSNLRRLGLAGTPINQVPEGVGRLKHLNDLGGFPVGGVSDDAKTQNGWKLEELEHLSHLRRLDLIKLERAALHTTGSVLADKRYPTWLGTTHLSSLKHLKLVDCKTCVYLPPIGQLANLRYLKIDGTTKVTKIGPEFVGCRGARANPRSMVSVAFPKLEVLVIRDLPNWEDWSFIEDAAGAAATEGGGDIYAEMRKGEALSPRLHLLPRLKKMELGGCPKLRALPRQPGRHATSLKELHLRGASCLKVVEDLQFLSEKLLIVGCEGLERVSNLPQVRELRLHDSPNLRRVEGLGSLQQLWLTKNMRDIPVLWMLGLQEQHRELHGEDVDVCTWCKG
ncbi:unnamed protein product [Triticum turgidum subsp. durum]|uniref:Uncharacterized protein n=1 Tax=Triticum turgidum subsp. durum TaxID=4567 RepID=A0A9R1RX65_TRITD|nr:unnamed protein product [Triticum turgidum subsp. durum]